MIEPIKSLKSTSTPEEIIEALTDKDGYIHPVKIIYHDVYKRRVVKSVFSDDFSEEHHVNIIDFFEDFSETDLYGKKGDDIHFYIDEGYASLTADAVFEFEFKYEGELTEDSKVKRGDLEFFKFYLDADAGFQTKLALDMNRSRERKNNERIFRMGRVTAKFVVPPAIPVWITFGCDIYSDYHFKADASLHANWGFESTHSLQAGGMYERAGNNFSPIYEYTPKNEIYPLNIEGEVNAYARLELYPRADIRFYGFFGPYAEIVPFVEGNYNATLQSQITLEGHETFLAWNSGIDLGLDLRVGTSLQFLWGTIERDYGPYVINCFNWPLWASPVDIELLTQLPEQIEPGATIELQVKVTDYFGLPVPLCPVYFDGDGVFSKQLPVTNASGIVTINWTPGQSAGIKEFASTIYMADKSVIKSILGSLMLADDDNGNGLTGQPCLGMPTFTDGRDGTVYNTVQIGDQCWLKENLKYLPEVFPQTVGSETDPHYYVYGYEGTSVSEAKATANYQNYGVLYNWSAAMNQESSSSTNPSGVQGVCPAGWHLPSDEEWTQLVDNVVDQGFPNIDLVNGAANALKSCRQIDSPLGGECATSEHPRWDSRSTLHYGTDQFGFSALPGGLRVGGGSFSHVGLNGSWWSSTEYSSASAWYQYMFSYYGYVRPYYYNKAFGLSVRCVKDPDTPVPSTYSLDLQVSPEESGTVGGTGTYQEGEEVEITAIANEGF